MPRFTKENAREHSLRGNLIRWSRPVPIDDDSQNGSNEPLEAEIVADTLADDVWLKEHHQRVREAVTKLDNHIGFQLTRRKPDGQGLNWLASALEKLSEQERQMSGRPLPGSLRPKQPSTKSDKPSVE